MSASPRALCHSDDVPEGDARGFPIDGNPRHKVIVVKVGGRLIGWHDSCPHYAGGTPMAWRTNAYLNGDGSKIVCASHGAIFNKETGECELGACLGQFLTPVPLSVNEDGLVFLATQEQENT